MARPPRIETPSGAFHVVSRGNERREIVRDPADRERLLLRLRTVAVRLDWRVLGYAVMTNHYHLLVETPGANLARGMHSLNSAYAQAFNRRHVRVGHLFEGRYSARLVETGEHLMNAIRYVVTNPQRAGLTGTDGDWRWTSHPDSWREAPPALVAVADLLAHFHEVPSIAMAQYVGMFSTTRPEPDFPHPLAIGNDPFIEDQVVRVPPDPEYARAFRTGLRPSLLELLPDPADEDDLLRATAAGYSLRQIANYLQSSRSTVHRRIGRAREAAWGQASHVPPHPPSPVAEPRLAPGGTWEA